MDTNFTQENRYDEETIEQLKAHYTAVLRLLGEDPEREGLIKRIIGLPGETVQITEGMIFIDGIQIDDVEGLDKIKDAGQTVFRRRNSLCFYADQYD